MANIMVADDDKQLRELIKTVLTSYGHNVILAEDGEVAINLMRKYGNRFQIIILDIVMPKKEGLETIREIRRINPSQWILAISGNSIPILPAYRNLKMATEAGANYTLEKPFDMHALAGLVGRFA